MKKKSYIMAKIIIVKCLFCSKMAFLRNSSEGAGGGEIFLFNLKVLRYSLSKSVHMVNVFP